MIQAGYWRYELRAIKTISMKKHLNICIFPKKQLYLQQKKKLMIDDRNLLLSIIVPVYNVENYVRPCIESIFRQGLEEDVFEVIIVNDGTKDRSMEVIQDIICQHKNITVINQENKGLSVARNKGIATAKGEYILMPDSDDLLIENSLKPLLEKAIETKVDLVVADFLIMNDKEIENYKYIPNAKDAEFIEKTGERLIMEDLVFYECYVWRTLYNRNLLINNNLTFFPGITYQDRPFTYACYLKAKKCLKSSSHLYIYRKGHTSAASYSFNKIKACDYCVSIADTWKYANSEKLSIQLQRKIIDNLYNNIFILCRRTVREIESQKDRIEISGYLSIIIPELPQTNLKQRIKNFMLKKTPHTYINLFYIYVNLYQDRILPFIKHHILFH